MNHRIIFVTRIFNPIHNTGASRTISGAAFGLANLGWDVHLVARCESDSYRNDFSEKISGVTVHFIPNINLSEKGLISRALNYIQYYFSCAYRLIYLVKKNDIVIVTTDPPLNSIIVASIARIRKAILVNRLLDIYPEVAERLGVKLIQKWPKQFLRYLCNISWKSARYNSVLGERMVDFVCKQGIPKDKVFLHPDWEDGELVRPISDNQNTLRNLWGLNDKFVVGYYGNMGRAHEFDTILNTASDLLHKFSNIIFLFVGTGYYRAYIEKIAKAKNLTNIVFKPYQASENLSESLSVANSHIISMQPQLEGLLVPSKLYTAMAAARPTLFIGDEDGEVARIIKKYNCGETVKVGDSNRLTKVILQYYNDPSLCNYQGIKARNAFEKNFDKPIAIRKWHELLKSIN